MKKEIISIAILSTGILSSGFAQETGTLSDTDSLKLKVESLQTDIKKLNKLKISGYIQAQYQQVDSSGAESFSGGNFATKDRFSVRRGRVKFTYTGSLTQYVLQLDATENGVAIKDAYAKVNEPLMETFSLTMGVFDRPFGFEIGYSSSLRESPERSRMFKTLFPGERDLGAMLTFEPPKTSKLNFLRADLAVINGTGIAAELDKQKDVIARLQIKRFSNSEIIKISGGMSYYNGGPIMDTASWYSMGNLANGDPAFIASDMPKKIIKGYLVKREYYGVDAQVSIDWVPGLTTLRAEYITGQQPGTSTSSRVPTSNPSNIYLRNFNGYYVYFLQNIAQSKHQLIAKYDVYDPNTRLSGMEIKSAGTTKFSKADIKHTTIGLGWVYRYDSNIKFTAYYDMVTNESTDISKFRSNLKDNVLTLRVQYKF